MGFELYVFDIGDVVFEVKTTGERVAIASYLDMTMEEFEKQWQASLRQLTIGAMTLYDFYVDILQKYGKHPGKARVLVNEHCELLRNLSKPKNWHMGIMDLIRELRRSATVVALTNTELEIGMVLQESKFFDHFDRAFLSTEIHLMKPDPECYHLVLSETGFAHYPEKAVMIDDREENVEGAIITGMNGIHFTSVKNLRDILASLE